MLALGSKGVLLDGPVTKDELEGSDLDFLARFSTGSDVAYGDEEAPVTPITKDEAEVTLAVSLVPAERVESGEQAGLEDGAADLALWKSTGLERGSFVFVTYPGALDADSSTYESVGAYLGAYKESLAGYYEIGLRAPTPTLKAFSEDVAALWRCGDLGANNDGGLEGHLDASQRRAMAANLLHTSPAHLADFSVPEHDDVKIVVVLRGQEPEASDESAEEADTDDDGASGDGEPNPAEYAHLSVAEIKEEIQRRNSDRDEDRHINVTGKKAELVAALEADDQATADAEAAARGAGEDPDGEGSEDKEAEQE